MHLDDLGCSYLSLVFGWLLVGMMGVVSHVSLIFQQTDGKWVDVSDNSELTITGKSPHLFWV